MNFLKRFFDKRPKFTAMIEMPEGTTKKIEIKEGKPVVDRELHIPVPVSYGYIPGTMCEDGDPLDVFVISDKYLNTGDLVSAKAIGIFECLDQGVSDDKIIAVAENSEYNNTKVLTKVAHYLLNYKPGFQIKNYRKISSASELEKYKK